jgi:hypothetical protein
MRAPVSRSRPLSSPGSGLLIFDQPFVGRLGCSASARSASRIITFVDQMPAAVRVFFGAPAVISSRRSFHLGQRWRGVGVVPAAGEHAPEQDRELPGGRHDRLAVPAPAAGALIERVQRPGLVDRGPRGLD